MCIASTFQTRKALRTRHTLAGNGVMVRMFECYSIWLERNRRKTKDKRRKEGEGTKKRSPVHGTVINEVDGENSYSTWHRAFVYPRARDYKYSWSEHLLIELKERKIAISDNSVISTHHSVFMYE